MRGLRWRRWTPRGVQARSALAATLVRLDESRQRDSGGAGLGLAIVAGIVDVHAGTVVAEEAMPPPGALMRVVLPLAEPVDSAGTVDDEGATDGAGQPATSTPVPSRA